MRMHPSLVKCLAMVPFRMESAKIVSLRVGGRRTTSSERNWLPCLLIGIVNAYTAGVCEPCELAPAAGRKATGMTDLETIQREWTSLEHRVSGVAVLVIFSVGSIFGLGAGALLIWWTV
jgi:hypothetical protein